MFVAAFTLLNPQNRQRQIRHYWWTDNKSSPAGDGWPGYQAHDLPVVQQTWVEHGDPVTTSATSYTAPRLVEHYVPPNRHPNHGGFFCHTMLIEMDWAVAGGFQYTDAL